MQTEHKIIVTLTLLLMAMSLPGQTIELRGATISAGAARLDNGSVVNSGQPLVGAFGSPQAGVLGNAGIAEVLYFATVPPHLPDFKPVTLNGSGGIRLCFQ